MKLFDTFMFGIYPSGEGKKEKEVFSSILTFLSISMYYIMSKVCYNIL